MGFCKFNRRCVGGALLLVLCACSSVPQKNAPAQTATPAPADAPLVLIANPYSQQTDSTPAAAKKQFSEAQVAMQAEDWANATRILQNLTQNYPNLSGPHVNLGIIAWRENKLEEAESHFSQALAVNPLNNDAYNQLAVLLREQGRFAEAEQWYLKALEVWPHAPVTLRNLGILYDLYMGQFAQALASYELALKVSAEPSNELEGWIIDIKRRMAAGENS